MRIYTFFAIIFFFIVILITTELYLKNIGLGDPVRYDSDLTYGYVPKINQKKERLKKSIVTINDVGLRSLENWKKNNKKKILFIGDSITYGGSYIDDTKIFSHLVCTKMKNYTCGNAGVNAYSVINMVMRFKYDERIVNPEIIIILVAPGDFYREYTDSQTAHFYLNNSKFFFPAITEAVSFIATKYDINKYISKKNDTSNNQHQDKLISYSINLLKEEIEKLKKNSDVYLYYTIEKNDKKSLSEINSKIKKELIKSFGEQLITLENILNDDSYFYDSVHYNEKGHYTVANEIYRNLSIN